MLWSYKYKPIYFKDLYFKDNLHLQCATWLSQWTKNSPFLFLSGPSGIGKTSLAYILARTYDLNIIEIENTTIKDILIISKGISLNNKKPIVIIDDIHITSNSNTPYILNVLNFLIKNKTKIHCPVILITNDLYSIPFKFTSSYFLTVNFKIPGKREMEGVINKCIEDNNITIDYRAFQYLIENNTDIRSVINTLQLLSTKDCSNIRLGIEGVNIDNSKQQGVNSSTNEQQGANPNIIISLTDLEKYRKITQGNIYKTVESIFRKKLEGFKELKNIYKGFGDKLSLGCFNTYLSKYNNTEELIKENNMNNLNNRNNLITNNHSNITPTNNKSLPKKDCNLLNKVIKISDFNFYYERLPEDYNYMVFGTYNTLFRGSMGVRVDLSVNNKCVHKRKVGHDYFYHEINPYLNLIIKNENLDFEYLKEISRKFNLKDLNILEKRCYEIKEKQRVFKYKYKEGVSKAVKIVINKRELNGI